MRKISKLILFIILLVPIKINALTGEIKINCSPATAKANTTITCGITATSDGLINGIKANIELSKNLEYIDFTTNEKWQGDGTGSQIGLYTGTNVEGEHTLGTLTLKVKDNVFDTNETISLTNCLYSNENFEKVSISNASTNIRVPSSNNRLSKLELSPGSIDFNPDNSTYNVSVDSSTIDINAEKEDINSVISGDIGTKNLKYGKNTLSIHVTSEGGDTRTYTLNITRIDNRSTENKLSSLTISGRKFSFKETTYTYNLIVGYETDNIKINAELKDKTSSFVKGYEPGIKNLKEGTNKIEIKVSAENGDIKTYTINITRQEDPNNKSDDNYLEDIKIENNDLDFSKEQEEYKITVDYNTNNLNIDATTSSNKSKIEITGNDNFQVGENTVTIKVTSKNNEVREYKIIVVKKDKDVILSSNNNLKQLEIEGYAIKFNKDTLIYNIKIKKEIKLNITALSEDENANVTILGNENLKNKSKIKIIVTAENGSKKEYTINISKQINYLLITVILETIIILGIIIYIIINNNRKKKYEQKDFD